MTNLKCPKGHDIEEKWIDDPMSIWLHCGDDEMLRISDVVVLCDHNDCNRHYFEMDCIKADELLENFEQLENDQAKNEHKKDKNGSTTTLSSEPTHESPITSDEDGWIDFNEQMPEIGQEVYGIRPASQKIIKGKVKWIQKFDDQKWGCITVKGETGDYDRGIEKWKPADHIPDPTKKVEYCQCDQSLGNALRCSVHHDQACGDGIGCKMEYYCGYCENAIEFGMVYHGTGSELVMHCGCKTLLDDDDKPLREEYCDQPFKEGVCIRVKKVDNKDDIGCQQTSEVGKLIAKAIADGTYPPIYQKLGTPADQKEKPWPKQENSQFANCESQTECEHDWELTKIELRPGRNFEIETYICSTCSLFKDKIKNSTNALKKEECEHDFKKCGEGPNVRYEICTKCKQYKFINNTNQPKQEEDCPRCDQECFYENRDKFYPGNVNGTTFSTEKGYCLTHNFWQPCPNDKPKNTCINKVIEALLNVEKNCYSDIGFFGREEIPHDRALLRNIIIKLKELKDK